MRINLENIFNLTLLDHRTGALGLPLYVLVDWYSQPEILQQYLYTATLFGVWYKTKWAERSALKA